MHGHATTFIARGVDNHLSLLRHNYFGLHVSIVLGAKYVVITKHQDWLLRLALGDAESEMVVRS